VPADPAAPSGFYETVGFRVCGTRAVRIDMLERVADLIRPIIAARTYNGGFIVTPDMMSLVGCSGEEFASLLRGLGYRSQVERVTPPKAEETKPEEAKPEEPSATEETFEMAETAFTGQEETENSAEAETPAPAEEAAVLDGAQTNEASENEESSGQVEMEIWRPQRRRHGGGKPETNRNRKPRRDKRKTGEEQEPRGGKSPRQSERGHRPQQKQDRKPREREPDPDSPFAALAVLKNRVNGNGS
tara:strand:- start:11624 stop:12358 length:735 start_codon:yes stop_codon:yes gene_type:complete